MVTGSGGDSCSGLGNMYQPTMLNEIKNFDFYGFVWADSSRPIHPPLCFAVKE